MAAAKPGILDIGRDGELATGLGTLNDQGLEHRSRSIDRGGVASGTRAQNDDLAVMRGRFCHGQSRSSESWRARAGSVLGSDKCEDRSASTAVQQNGVRKVAGNC